MTALLIAAALLFILVFSWAYAALEWASKPTQDRLNLLQADVEVFVKQRDYAQGTVAALDVEIHKLRAQIDLARENETRLQQLITSVEDDLAEEKRKNFVLKAAVARLYGAAYWSPDRKVKGEAKLWEALRDAAEIKPGTSPKPRKSKAKRAAIS